MTEWQKVRVQFTDADGDEVSAVMWSLGGSLSNYKDGTPSDHPDYLYMERGVMVKVTPIRELPAGVGAVIRVTASNDSFNLYGDSRDIFVSDVSGEWWGNSDGDVCANTAMQDWQYEVLSEGIKL